MRKRRAVIFDDEKVILHVLKYVLSAMQYDVITYTEPVGCPLYTKSLAFCPKENPCADVLITDFRMPRMTGLDMSSRPRTGAS